mmetsp:Transcript_48909/g.140381  ORF Transcript_48909/g.140381 Transcript_48909/m.140381 type:complete len:200 (-) Transcript_48909:820-1419(-)
MAIAVMTRLSARLSVSRQRWNGSARPQKRKPRSCSRSSQVPGRNSTTPSAASQSSSGFCQRAAGLPEITGLPTIPPAARSSRRTIRRSWTSSGERSPTSVRGSAQPSRQRRGQRPGSRSWSPCFVRSAASSSRPRPVSWPCKGSCRLSPPMQVQAFPRLHSMCRRQKSCPPTSHQITSRTNDAKSWNKSLLEKMQRLKS